MYEEKESFHIFNKKKKQFYLLVGVQSLTGNTVSNQFSSNTLKIKITQSINSLLRLRETIKN
jgi:hypothetical protein